MASTGGGDVGPPGRFRPKGGQTLGGRLGSKHGPAVGSGLWPPGRGARRPGPGALHEGRGAKGLIVPDPLLPLDLLPGSRSLRVSGMDGTRLASKRQRLRRMRQPVWARHGLAQLGTQPLLGPACGFLPHAPGDTVDGGHSDTGRRAVQPGRGDPFGVRFLRAIRLSRERDKGDCDGGGQANEQPGLRTGRNGPGRTGDPVENFLHSEPRLTGGPGGSEAYACRSGAIHRPAAGV